MAINWNLSDDGVLTIQGEGRMPDYACGGRAAAPWSDERDKIRHISVCEGITEIGMKAFEDCENLQSVDLPETVVRIHAEAFFNCKNLTQVRTAAKDAKFAYIYAPGLKAWKERRRLEKIAKEKAEQARAAEEKRLKERKEKSGQEAEASDDTEEQKLAAEREKLGQVLLKVRKNKDGQVVLEVWKDKNGQLLEVRTGKYGQVVEARKDKDGRIMEVRKLKNGQVLTRQADRRNSASEEQNSVKEDSSAEEQNLPKEQSSVEEQNLPKEQSSVEEQNLSKEQNSAKEQGASKEQSFEEEQNSTKKQSLAEEQTSVSEAAVLQKSGKRRSTEDPEIRFGLNSFYNVPWAKEKWSDFYVIDGVLYACLSDGKELTIPEGVHTLGKFALKSTEAESILLPQSLETICEFAFADSQVQSLEIPDGVTKIEDYAFADSSLKYLVFSGGCRCSVSEGTFRNSAFRYKKCAEGFPELFELKAFQEKKKYADYRQLRVVRKKMKSPKNIASAAEGDVEKNAGLREGDNGSGSGKTANSGESADVKNGIYGALRINVAKHLLRKMTTGSVILMIRSEEGRVSRIESFIWDKEEKLINEYLVYPCLDDGWYNVYRDSFTWQEKEDFEDAFQEEDATLLEKQGGLRLQQEGCIEHWFWSNDRESVGGPLELNLLKYWRREHGVHVDSEEECRERLSGLSFVYI